MQNKLTFCTAEFRRFKYVCRVTGLFYFVLAIIPTLVSILFINCYSRILTVCYKNEKENTFHFPNDKVNSCTQSPIFIKVFFCVPYAQLLRHLNSDCGRQIAHNVRNYKQASWWKIQNEQPQRRRICQDISPDSMSYISGRHSINTIRLACLIGELSNLPTTSTHSTVCTHTAGTAGKLHLACARWGIKVGGRFLETEYHRSLS